MAEQQAAAPAAEAAPVETITDVLASDNLDKFRDEPAEAAEPEPAKEKPAKRGGKPKAKDKPKLSAVANDEGPGDEEESDDEPAEPTEEGEPEELPENEDAEAAAFSDDALSTPEGVKRAATIALAARAAAEKRNHILDRYDQRSKARMADAKKIRESAEGLAEQTNGIRNAIARDLRLMREPGITGKEKLDALSRISGRPGHEVLDELTAGIMTDGREQPKDPTVRALEQALAESNARLDQFVEQQKAQQIQGETAAQKHQIARVYTEIQAEVEDSDTYPHIAAGIESEDWTPEEVADLVAGKDGIMVRHFRKKNARLDKSEALRILEGRLARRSGTVERAPQGASGTGATKKPGSPARGAGRGTTLTPSVADRSTGSVRELKTREERIADLQRDPAALRQLFPMLG